MRSALYICNSIPLNTDSTPDKRYHVCLMIPGATAIYGLKYLIHAQPEAPVPPAVFATLFDGTTDWHWSDVAIPYPTLNPHTLHNHWQESDGYHHDTINVYNGRVSASAVLQTYLTNQPPHMWFGDPP